MTTLSDSTKVPPVEEKKASDGALDPDLRKLSNNLLSKLPDLVKGCYLDNVKIQYECLQKIRRLASLTSNPPLKQIIQTGILPRLLQFCTKNDNPTIQFEALWIITNLTSGDFVSDIIKNNGIQILINCISNSKNKDVLEQCVWALGNIAGEHTKYRNMILKQNGLKLILHKLKPYLNKKNTQDLGLLRNGVWAISNFCRNKPLPETLNLVELVSIFVKMLRHSDREILQDVCWGLNYISDTDDSGIHDDKIVNLLLNSGSIPVLIKLLHHESPQLQHPALRIIGNVISICKEDVTLNILKMGLLQSMTVLLSSDKGSIRKETCWVLSNICSVNDKCIEMIVQHNMYPILLKLIKNDNFVIQKEAIWCLSNTTVCATDKQLKYLVNNGIMNVFVNSLSNNEILNNNSILLVLIEGIENLLYFGDRDKIFNNGNNICKITIEENNGIEKFNNILKLNAITNDIIERVGNILTQYFTSDSQNSDSISNSDNVYQF